MKLKNITPSHEQHSHIFYHDGISVDEKGRILFSEEAKKDLSDMIDRIRIEIPEEDITPTNITEDTAQEVIDILAINHVSGKKINKVMKRIRKIFQWDAKETPKVEKVMKKMEKETHIPSIHLDIEYTSTSWKIEKLPTGIIVRKDATSFEGILHSLQTRCSFNGIFTKRGSK